MRKKNKESINPKLNESKRGDFEDHSWSLQKSAKEQ
jgi:hypothetical protein